MRFLNRKMNFYRPLAARKDCTIGETTYKAGDDVFRENHNIRELRRAYNRKMIGHPFESFKQAIKKKEKDDFFEQVQTEEPKAELRHRGGAYYDVVLDGEQINENALKKAEAQSLIEELNYGELETSSL